MKEKQIIMDFCSIWTHPYISILSPSNELIINIKQKETQDCNYKLQINRKNHPFDNATPPIPHIKSLNFNNFNHVEHKIHYNTITNN
jgi:hypothetical protein